MENTRLVQEFAEAMKALYGDELLALYVVGENAWETGPAGPKLMAVLREVGHSELKSYAAINAGWRKKGIHAPLMLTPRTLERSCDVFPIEFLEMKEKNTLLHGEDLLTGLAIGLENLRRECEEQVKGKLIHLRQEYVEAGGDHKAVAALIAASVGHFAEVMRNLVRLGGKPAPVDSQDAVRTLCAEAGLDPAPFLMALELRRGAKKGAVEVDNLYGAYLAGVAGLADYVDGLEQGLGARG